MTLLKKRLSITLVISEELPENTQEESLPSNAQIEQYLKDEALVKAFSGVTIEKSNIIVEDYNED